MAIPLARAMEAILRAGDAGCGLMVLNLAALDDGMMKPS
jgi:hypothetical protein